MIFIPASACISLAFRAAKCYWISVFCYWNCSGWNCKPWPSRSQNWMFVYFIIILSRSQQFPTSSSQNQVELGEWPTGHFMHWNYTIVTEIFMKFWPKKLKSVLVSQLFLLKNTEICAKLCQNTEIIAICYWSEFQRLAAWSWCKTAVTPLLMPWSYCILALSWWWCHVMQPGFGVKLFSVVWDYVTSWWVVLETF